MRFSRSFLYGVRSLSPLAFVLMALGNIVFCALLFVRSNQQLEDSDNETFIRCTNLISSVSAACSNEILRVRSYLDGQIAIRTGVFVRTNGVVSSGSFSSSFSSPDVPVLKPVVSLPFQMFRSGGADGVALNGYYFRVGDNFGYGRIEEIYSEVVLTSDYRIVRSVPRSDRVSQTVNKDVL